MNSHNIDDCYYDNSYKKPQVRRLQQEYKDA